VADAARCPRCGGAVRPPDIAVSAWRCADCGPVPPVWMATRLDDDAVDAVAGRVAGGVPLWCPWPLPSGWLVTGVGWAGDDRDGASATVLTCSGPSPIHAGPADLVIIAEKPGVGLGNRYAGLAGTHPGELPDAQPHARIKAGGRDTPMWSVTGATDRVAYIGEAGGLWLYAIAWPADAGYLLAEPIELTDLNDWRPTELVYGAPSPQLRGMAA
jgi:hypothetical protein